MRPPRGSGFIYRLYREHIKTHSCQILKALIFDMWYSTKFVQIMVLWSKMASTWRSQSLWGCYCSLTLPLGVEGLYAVRACGISWSYILFYIGLHIVKT